MSFRLISGCRSSGHRESSADGGLGLFGREPLLVLPGASLVGVGMEFAVECVCGESQRRQNRLDGVRCDRVDLDLDGRVGDGVRVEYRARDGPSVDGQLAVVGGEPVVAHLVEGMEELVGPGEGVPGVDGEATTGGEPEGVGGSESQKCLAQRGGVQGEARGRAE